MGLIYIILITVALYAVIEFEEKRFNKKQKEDANT